MTIPGTQMSLWTKEDKPRIKFNPLPEPLPLLLGWPNAAGQNITSKILWEAVGNIELVGGTRSQTRYRIEFKQHDANAYVIYNGLSE